MGKFSMKYKIIIFVSLSAFCCSLPILAVDWFAITPWSNRAYGYLSVMNSYVDNDTTTEPISATTVGGQLQLDSRTHGYIYRPWVLQFDVLAGLFSNTQQFSIDTLEEQKLQQGKLNLAFNLFERRSYPVGIEIKTHRNEMSGNTDTINDLQQINLMGKFKLDDEASVVNYTYRDQNEQFSLDDRDYRVKTLDVNWQNNNQQNKWTANVMLQKQSLSIADDENITAAQETSAEYGIFTFGHSWQSDHRDTITSLLTFGKDKQQQQQLDENNQRIQLTSFAIFSDEDQPRIRYTLNLLADVFENTSDNTELNSQSVNESQNVVINGGLFFDINDDWSLSSNLSAINNQAAGITTNSSTAFTGLLYNKDWQIFERTNYNLSINNQLRVQKSDRIENVDTRVNSSIDHGISWDKQLTDSNLSVTVSQQLSDQFGGEDQSSSQKNNLGHRAAISWFSEESGKDSFIKLSFADRRHWSADPELFQQVNLQLSSRENLTEVSGWDTNVNAQWTRTLDSSESERVDSAITGSFGYVNSHFLEISNLRIRSNIHFPIDKLLFNDGKRSNERTNWRTELVYGLGLLEARSEIILTDESKYIRLELRRAFSLL